MPKKKFTESESNSTRAKLISSGLALIGQNGYQETSLRELTKISGQNLASISYHFGDKFGLYCAIIEEMVVEYRKVLNDITHQIDAKKRKIKASRKLI